MEQFHDQRDSEADGGAMATYVTLQAAGLSLEPGGIVPAQMADALVSLAETVAGGDATVPALYVPLVSVIRTDAEPLYGSYASDEAWRLVRTALLRVADPSASGCWVLGAVTVAVQPAVVRNTPDRYAPALTISLAVPEDDVLDAINGAFPGIEWKDGRGWSATIASVEVFLFENEPDEYDAFFHADAEPTDWTWMLAAGSDRGPADLPAAATAFAARDVGILNFLGAALDAKHARAGLRRAWAESPRHAWQWLRVRSSRLVTEVPAPLGLEPANRDAVVAFLKTPDARWSSLTEVHAVGGDRPRASGPVVAEHRVRAGKHHVRVSARHEHIDDAASALILEIRAR